MDHDLGNRSEVKKGPEVPIFLGYSRKFAAYAGRVHTRLHLESAALTHSVGPIIRETPGATVGPRPRHRVGAADEPLGA